MPSRDQKVHAPVQLDDTARSNYLIPLECSVKGLKFRRKERFSLNSGEDLRKQLEVFSGLLNRRSARRRAFAKLQRNRHVHYGNEESRVSEVENSPGY